MRATGILLFFSVLCIVTSQDQVYKDDNHKTEMALTVTEFEALYGFVSLEVARDGLPPLQYMPEVNSKDRAIAKSDLSLVLKMVVSLVTLFLVLIVCMSYYTYRQRQAALAHQAEQEQEMIQLTNARRALAESMPVHVVPERTTFECPICWTVFAEGSNLRLLSSCNHIICFDCVQEWWADLSRTPNCPTCRYAYV